MVRRSLPLALLLAAALGGGAAAQQTPTPAPSHPALRAELLRREAEDQAARKALIEAGFQTAPDSLRERLARVDSANTAWLKALVEREGWPTPARVGADGVHAAFLIVQHTPDHAFQAAMLPHVREAWRAGAGVDGEDVALLTDRVLRHQGRPQRYGTQADFVDGRAVPQPLEEPETVDERRREMGMMPLAEYLAFLEQLYKQQPAKP